MTERARLTELSGLAGLAPSIVGVIDLRGGRAVHAIAGLRDQYRDVIASGINDGDAIGLALRYRNLEVPSLYIADLDAISGASPQTRLLTSLTTLAKTVLIDVGPLTATIVKALPATAPVRFITPTESFCSIDEWSSAVEQLGSQRVVMGLDLCGNRIRVRDKADHPAIQSAELLDNIAPWVTRAIAIGVSAIVVLDLSFVGTSRGVGTANTCQVISQHWPEVELISGGGVRNGADVQTLLDSGCDRVLVATALHK